MKTVWKEVLQEYEDLHRKKATKADFTRLFGKAYVKAFTSETIRAAFSSTGIYPYNPEVIQPEQMMPSMATSTSATYPLQQTSPVRAVMAAFRQLVSLDFPFMGCYVTVCHEHCNGAPVLGKASVERESRPSNTIAGDVARCLLNDGHSIVVVVVAIR